MYVNTPVIMHCEWFFTLTSTNIESKDPVWITDFDQTKRQKDKPQKLKIHIHLNFLKKSSYYIVFTYLGNQ